MGVEGNLRLHLWAVPKEDLWGQRVPALDQRSKVLVSYVLCFKQLFKFLSFKF